MCISSEDSRKKKPNDIRAMQPEVRKGNAPMGTIQVKSRGRGKGKAWKRFKIRSVTENLTKSGELTSNIGSTRPLAGARRPSKHLVLPLQDVNNKNRGVEKQKRTNAGRTGDNFDCTTTSVANLFNFAFPIFVVAGNNIFMEIEGSCGWLKFMKGVGDCNTLFGPKSCVFDALSNYHALIDFRI